MLKILLIDDDERLAELLGCFFERYSIELESALRPSQAIAKLDLTEKSAERFDLIILDVMLPEMDGFEVCRHIRKSSNIPIIMLTARGEVMDRIVGLEIGADDYLPKPFEPRELLARINTVLKRAHYVVDKIGSLIQFEGLQIDPNLRQVQLSGQELQLSSGEYALLLLFAENPGKIFSRDEIMNHLRGTESEIYSRAIDILVSRLRQKLKPRNYIKTVRGRGYCFVGKAADVSAPA